MKKIILSLVAIATISLSSFGQAPEGFKYQEVVRDAGGLILNNQAVGMRLTVQQGSIGGTAVYAETFSPTTNAYGLVNLEIGTGTTTDDFTSIDWANGPYFMETAVDFLGGMTWVVMGTSQLMSVPYALYAKTAENVTNDLIDDADADPTNELQDWSSLPGIPAELADGTDDVDDADADPTNELQDWSNLPGIPAELADGTDDVDDADADPTNELQDWSNLPGIPAGLSDGTDDVDDADSDPTNELQDWSNLPGIPAGLSDGIDNVDDADADPTNEMNTGVALTGTDLEITDGNGTIVTDLSSLQDGVNDADADPVNEIQTISRGGTIVTLSNGGGTFEDSVGVYTAGTGIDITNNVVSTTSACGLSIGDAYQGGIIFYLDVSNCHGLVAKATDELGTYQWSSIDYNAYAYAFGIYLGAQNTKKSIALAVFNSSTCPAASVCDNLTSGGFTDWYLPSTDELGMMYVNLHLQGLGGFASNFYWSSTEAKNTGGTGAWIQGFSNLEGYAGYHGKSYTYSVRAVRAF